MDKIILASQSPRRKELMHLLPFAFEVETKEVEEHLDATQTAKENVMALAYQKAEAVSKIRKERWVIGCDTLVSYNNVLMGKPKDEKEAMQMLQFLSNKTHQVYTGVCILNESKTINRTFVVETQVKMKALTQEMLQWYVNTKEPLDKAGAYGIQGYGALLVEKIEGDYFNIVGFPVSKIYDELMLLLK